MSRYKVFITPDALREIKDLPGHIRQRAKRAISGLVHNAFPAGSKSLNLPHLKFTVCRIRLDKWRIVYVLTEDEKIIDVVALRKRPPYDYGDLESLLSDS